MRYLFAAGGTGGHINPALAVAGFICSREPEAEILFVGAAGRMEEQLVPAAGYMLRTITISGIARELNLAALRHNARLVRQLQKAAADSKKILRDFNPDMVVGFGGYVTGPVLRMAAKMGIPTAVHESNSFPGVANKALAKRVDRVLLTTQDAQQYFSPKSSCVITGMPVRGELLEAQRTLSRFELGLVPGQLLVFSMGGSLGAKPINDAVVDLITAQHTVKGYAFIHAAGNVESCEAVKTALAEKGVDLQREKHITIRPYVEDMARVLSAADLVICRAGASSINEFMALGKPSILIPAPHLAENHQYYNALTLQKREAAVLLEQKDLTGASLTKAVCAFLEQPETLVRCGENAKEMAVTDANERIYRVIGELLAKQDTARE